MIHKAIKRAYQLLRERDWNTIYWAIDLHGTCIKSNYETGGYEFINEDVIRGLQAIASRPENIIILWSSAYEREHKAIIDFFAAHGINVAYFNENPQVENTKTGDFSKKFYMSVIVDDKAGFDADSDWKMVAGTVIIESNAWYDYLDERERIRLQPLENEV